jgi:hypothetical protein
MVYGASENSAAPAYRLKTFHTVLKEDGLWDLSALFKKAPSRQNCPNRRYLRMISEDFAPE